MNSGKIQFYCQLLISVNIANTELQFLFKKELDCFGVIRDASSA